jgi:hypothetical protein
MSDEISFLLLQITAVADSAAVIWLIVGLINRRAKPATRAVAVMVVVTLAMLIVTLPNWAC